MSEGVVAYRGGVKKFYLGVVADLVLVTIFAALGVITHDGALTAPLLIRVAWPFLLALLVAHLILRTWKASPWQVWPRGVFIVLITVVGAMTIRSLLGEGTDPAFVIVAFCVNTLFLLGWRLLARLLTRRSGQSPA